MSKQLNEKWAKEVDVKSTGENAGKSIDQLKKEIAALRGKPGNKEKMGKLLFALRAKEGWKKNTGVSQEMYHFTEEDLSLAEKWGNDVKIHHTGENTDKTIEQLKKEIEALRGKPGNKEKMGKLLFALRAKEGWKKHTGVAQEMMSEPDLNFMLNYIFESHPEKKFYMRFIDEATLEQKIGLLMYEAESLFLSELEDNILDELLEIKDPNKQGHLKKGLMSHLGAMGGLGVFWIAYRAIRAAFDKCSRKCSIMKPNTFMRQKCMAECNVHEMEQAVQAANKIKCGPKDKECPEKKKEMIKKYQQKLVDAKNKHLRYVEKHKKLRYTV